MLLQIQIQILLIFKYKGDLKNQINVTKYSPIQTIMKNLKKVEITSKGWIPDVELTVWAISSMLLLLSVMNVSAFTRAIQKNSNVVTINYTFGKLKIDTIADGTATPHLDGLTTVDEEGKPALPILSESFQIPENMEVEDIYVDASYNIIPMTVSSAQPPRIDSEEGEVLELYPMTPFNGYWPKNPIETYLEGEYRDVKMAYFDIMPIMYNYNDNQIKFAQEITVTIHLVPIPQSEEESIFHISSSDEINCHSTFTILNTPNKINTPIAYNREKPQRGYLIICPEEYVDAANQLATWKRVLGFTCIIKDVSSDKLKNPENTMRIIKDEYDCNSALEYVLLLGGGDQIVPFPGRYSKKYDYYTDHYFSCMDGDDDVIADLKIGRMPAQSADEAETMVANAIFYETCPPTMNSDYYKKGVHAAYFQSDNAPYNQSSRRFVKTSEDIIDYVSTKDKQISRVYYANAKTNPVFWSDSYSFGEEIPEFLQRPNFAWDGNAKDLVNEMNDGVHYVLYRGHGSVNSFASIGFNIESSKQLKNRDERPIVFGITCLSGVFYLPGQHFAGKHSISEELLANEYGGAAGIIAANQISYSGYNDHFAGGIFSAIYPDPGIKISSNDWGTTISDLTTPIRDLGGILQYAGHKFFQAYGSNEARPVKSYSRYSREIFHCLGDPSIKIYVTEPQYGSMPSVGISDDNHYHVTEKTRDVVVANHRTGEVKVYAAPVDLEVCNFEEIDDISISCISENTIPSVFFGCALIDDTNTEIAFKLIQPEGDKMHIMISNPDIPATIEIFDVYGNSTYKSNVTNGEVFLYPSPGLNIVTLQVDGKICDKKSIMIK